MINRLPDAADQVPTKNRRPPPRALGRRFVCEGAELARQKPGRKGSSKIELLTSDEDEGPRGVLRRCSLVP